MHDRAIISSARRHPNRAAPLPGRCLGHHHASCGAQIDTVQESAARASRGEGLMSEPTHRIPDAIRSRRAVGHVLFCDRPVIDDRDDAGFVDLRVCRRGLRGAHGIHHRRIVRAGDNDVLIARGDARAEMEDGNGDRLTSSIRGCPSADSRHRDPAVGDTSSERGRAVREYGHGDPAGRPSWAMGPLE